MPHSFSLILWMFPPCLLLISISQQILFYTFVENCMVVILIKGYCPILLCMVVILIKGYWIIFITFFNQLLDDTLQFLYHYILKEHIIFLTRLTLFFIFRESTLLFFNKIDVVFLLILFSGSIYA